MVWILKNFAVLAIFLLPSIASKSFEITQGYENGTEIYSPTDEFEVLLNETDAWTTNVSEDLFFESEVFGNETEAISSPEYEEDASNESEESTTNVFEGYNLFDSTTRYDANTIQPSEAGRFKAPNNMVQGTVFVVNENLLQIKDYKITEEGNFFKNNMSLDELWIMRAERVFARKRVSL